MAIKTLTIDYRKINELSDSRLSPSYYYVDVFFERFNENVKTLEELGAEISSGSYIDTYLEKEQGVTFIRVGNVKPFNMDENENLTNEEFTEEDITPIGAEDEEPADLHDSEDHFFRQQILHTNRAYRV